MIPAFENCLKWIEKLSDEDQEKLGREMLQRVDELWMKSESSKQGAGRDNETS